MARREDPNQVAARALAQARRRNAPHVLQKALIEAGLVESGLQHERYRSVGSGDRDSIGFLQQRPSAGWGPFQSIETDTNQFLDRGLALLRRGFRGSSGQLAQAVQRSAFPGRYMQRGREAERYVRGAGGGSGSRIVDGSAGNDTAQGGQVQSPSGVPQGSEGLLPLLQALQSQPAPRSTASLPGPAFSAQAAMPGGYQTPVSGGGPAPKPDMNALLAAVQTVGGNTGTVPQVTASGQPVGAATAAGKAAATGGIKITGPNPGRIQPQVRNFMQRIAGVAGETVVGSDGTGHSKYTTSGNVSEHFTGSASDIPAAGSHLTRLGRSALVAAGMDPRKARGVKGGLFNLYSGGKRYQIIFNTNEGGNHYDHLHVGVSRRR